MAPTFADLTSDQLTFIENAGIGDLFVTSTQANSIAFLLHLSGKSREELAAIRNSVVRHLADLTSAARDAGDVEAYNRYHNNMSGITAVIDQMSYGF